MVRAFLWLLLIPGVLVAIAYLAICFYLVFQQGRLIFFPSPIIETTPAAFNLNYREVWLPVTSKSGKKEFIHSWWIPAAGEYTLLYLHGNGINVGANVRHVYRFYRLGFSVLLIDYRGYGLSKGNFPEESQVYEDAETAWKYLVEELKIAPEEIFIFGHSLGGAIAINLALKHPEAAGLIVESTFTSIRQMVDKIGSFWMFPIDLILHQHFNSIGRISKLQMPVLFIHGMADSLIPYQMSEKLFAAAPEPKQILLVPEAGHNDVGELAEEQYLQTVREFVELASKN